MNNLECVVAVLASHREARRWTDEAVANDLLMQLDLDPTADAKKATPVIPPGITEAEVVAHEAAAKEAVDKAKAARAALDAQGETEDEAKATAAADQAKAAALARDTAAKQREAMDHASAAKDGPASTPPAAHVNPPVPLTPTPAPIVHAAAGPVPLHP